MSEPTDPQAPAQREIYERRELEAVAARWDAKAATWDRELEDPACHLNEDDAYQRFLRETRGIVETRHAFCLGRGLIDAGCGTGLVLAELAWAFAWGLGVDISPEMIRRAGAKSVPRARFLVGDCFHLPEFCPAAGAVLSRGVLLSHYGQEQGERLLRAARDALAPGGFAVFDFLNEMAQDWHAHRPGNKTHYTPQAAELLARRAGFARVTILGETERRVLLLFAEKD